MRQSLPIFVLLAILGLVVFKVVKPTIRGGGPSDPVSAMADIHGGIKSALDVFKEDIGSFPKGSNGLVELVEQPAGATNWHGPYLKKIPVDPWGHKYIYEYPGKHNPNSYDLSSFGPDGTVGTDDDIGNWMK